jgi:hypothetical protein
MIEYFRDSKSPIEEQPSFKDDRVAVAILNRSTELRVLPTVYGNRKWRTHR